jgi:glycosyltransferase involved in cell wall biosynthesis
MSTGNRRDDAYIPAVRDAARAAFEDRYGADLTLTPIVAVIAALDEEQSIAAVLEAIPESAFGRAISTIVIDDGSTDGTSAVAEKFDSVHLARLERNCGHGVALRLGYALAARYGAEMVVTLDADMQWDPVEIPTVVEPIISGEADFVIGSRVLGATENTDSFRNAGVVFFARAISLLTGTKVTDTSSGFRAMRVEVTQQVTQIQTQYQTSELLIGAIFAGFRIAERPITMHQRFAGESKKGHNAFYAVRYARVIGTTWWRERRHRGRARS